jgi:GH15 family glucan-1,4-alpha-glucosidase
MGRFEAAWRFENALLRSLQEALKRPDEGIWEVRGPRRPVTQVMAWTAFDRAIKGIKCFKQEDASRDPRLRSVGKASINASDPSCSTMGAKH